MSAKYPQIVYKSKETTTFRVVRMAFVEVELYLFGKPEWEFDGKVNPKTIKAKGDELRKRLCEVANNLEKLSDKGCDYESTLYEIILTKDISKSAAKKELKEMGISAEVHVMEE